MLFLCICSFALALFYCGLIIYYLIGWKQLPTEAFAVSENFITKVSIIIPARNEEQNIGVVLQNIAAQNFPKKNIEIIVVDDHSTDNTFQIAKKFAAQQSEIHFQILILKDAGTLETAFKKKAIEWAIQQSKNELIITTDADCTMPQTWLSTMVTFYEQTNAKMIAAPVKYNFADSFLQQFQALDFIGLIGITGASIQHKFYNMCNGANLCYEKKAFFEVNGFAGNDNISSGDDMFLMHKMAQHFPGKISFLKNDKATVITHPKETISGFIQQRLRWTSKSTSYSDKRITWILVMVYLFNVSILFNFLAAIFFGKPFLFMALLQVFFKFLADYLFLQNITSFFGQKKLMQIFLPAQMLHVIYIIAVGLLGQMGSFHWKGRKLKK